MRKTLCFSLVILFANAISKQQNFNSQPDRYDCPTLETWKRWNDGKEEAEYKCGMPDEKINKQEARETRETETKETSILIPIRPKRPILIRVTARNHGRKPYSDAVVANQLPNDRVSGYGTLINSRKCE